MSKYITVKQAAGQLRLGYAKIRQMCESGEIRAWRLIDGGEWRIDPTSLANYKSNRDNAYTVKEACAILEVQESQVRKLIYRGLLQAYHSEQGHRIQWFIRIGSLNSFIMRCLNEGGISPELIAEKRKLLRDPQLSEIGE